MRLSQDSDAVPPAAPQDQAAPEPALSEAEAGDGDPGTGDRRGTGDPREGAPERDRALIRRLSAAAAVVIAVVALFQAPPGRWLLRVTGIAAAPAPYAALYFAHPAALPRVLPSGHAGVDFAFTVRNASRASGDYRWTIQAVHGTRAKAVGHGTMVIAAGGTRTEHAAFSVLCQGGTLDVVVGLAAPAESIDFRAACGG